jgi:hypothetical protein
MSITPTFGAIIHTVCSLQFVHNSAERNFGDDQSKRISISAHPACNDIQSLGELDPSTQLALGGPSLRTLDGTPNKRIRKNPRLERQYAPAGDQGEQLY